MPSRSRGLSSPLMAALLSVLMRTAASARRWSWRCSCASPLLRPVPHPPVERLGTGAGTVWVLWPRERPTSIVVFGHGWSTPLPTDGFAPWLAHLRRRGSIVIYPRYRTSAAESVGAALRGLRVGLAGQASRECAALHLPVVAIGKSFGGSAVFSYAAAAAALARSRAQGDPQRVPGAAARAAAARRDRRTAPSSSSSSATRTRPPAAPVRTRSGAGSAGTLRPESATWSSARGPDSWRITTPRNARTRSPGTSSGRRSIG